MHSNSNKFKANPKDLIIDAVNDNREIGSSTCVMAMLDE